MDEEKSKSALGRFLSGKGFYIVLILCVAAIGISGYVLLFSENNAYGDLPASLGEWDEDSLQVVIDQPAGPDAGPVTGQPDSEPVSAGDAETSGGAVFVSAPAELEAAAAPESAAPAAEDAAESAAAEDFLWVWPVVSGEVSAPWTVETLVYHPALGDWRVHDGVDIACAAGSDVMAAGPGVVTAVFEDPVYGMTVEIDHKNGFVSTYSNLTNEVDAQPGDAVVSGQVLGRVGQTAAGESGSGGHLHLKLTREGKSADPMEYIS